ncbi:MAG TPA: hypothetical protein DDZ41_07750 [Flavobacterium sp.]|nr:hypothetical protein [Flavobacterium sp.]
MKKIDYILQNERIKQAKKYIAGTTVLDIGCHFGELFKNVLKTKKISGDGIDDVLKTVISTKNYTLYPGLFPEDFKPTKTYDTITLLAVLEHIPIEKTKQNVSLFYQLLNVKGRVIITIPSKKVDIILSILLFLKLIDGMDVHNHQDFDRELIKEIFISNGFKLLVEKKFQLGLNNLYVFEKI